MIPHPAQSLTDLAMRLVTSVAPNTTDRFSEADAGLIAQLMFTLGQEFERSIATRMQDIDEIKTLFADSDGCPDKPALDAFLSSEPQSLNLGDVNDLHDQGMMLLTELHAWAEAQDDALNRAIWDYLRRHTERHKFELP